MSPSLHAQAASDESVRLSVALQDMLDAVNAGATVTAADLRVLIRDLGVLRYSTARTLHAIAQEQRHRRLVEEV